MKERITKEEALSFLLTHIVVERSHCITLDQLALFNLSNVAQQASERLNEEEGAIPHEVIEQLATEFLDQ